MTYRRARRADIRAMAEIRAADWGSEPYWRERIWRYLAQQLHPREARLPRVAFVAVDHARVVGLIAGHLTRRFGCGGELEWISIREKYRGRGVATALLCRLAKWFTRHEVLRVCVDVEPSNEPARRFYARHGAEDMKPHWMVWKDIRRALEALTTPRL